MNHIQKTVYPKYIQLVADEGYLITNYVEGVTDIKDYSSCERLVCPLSTDVENIYYAVTLEQDAIYQEEKRKALEPEDEDKKEE